MPNDKIVSNSVVIVAKSHNPTILSDGFLLSSKIISNKEEVNSGSIFISPPLSNVNFTNGTNMLIELERMKLVSKSGIDAVVKAEKYFNASPHIKCDAIGINFAYSISGNEVGDWFSKYDIGGLQANGVKFVRKLGETKTVNITVSIEKEDVCKMDFNYHYKFALEPFKDILFKFEEEYETNKKISDEILTEIFK